MIHEKENFFPLEREPGRIVDFATRQVVLMRSENLGQYIGPAPRVFLADILLSDGTILENQQFKLVIEGREEFVLFEQEIGGFSGILSDGNLKELRFNIKLP